MAKAPKAKKPPKAKRPGGKTAGSYRHETDTVPMRPEIGTQANFRKKKAPRTYRYDSSLSPALEWDGAAGRELGEWLIAAIERASVLPAPHAFAKPEEFKDAGGATVLSVSSLHEAVDALKRLSKPFLNWAGKAERLSFDVPTLPLFVHERLSTQKIVKTLIGHKTDKQVDLFDLFGDPHRSIVDQTLHAYEYPDKWVNRLILGDSLVVMNSLLHYEGLGGRVQMIYIDPPYGVKFGSNFQPFVRKRDVSHNDDEDLTREPEMVKAYRDTWELGLHSYLTYMRDRLLLARDLLTPSGSVFVQISDENLHHVREVVEEVFGPENFVSQITFVRGGSQTSAAGLPSNCDFLLWFARDRERLKRREVLLSDGGWASRALDLWEELPDGTRRRISDLDHLAEGARPFTDRSMESARTTGSQLNKFEIEFEGSRFRPRRGWSTTPEGAE
jgi:adenine-specific DNA-methyltransferase